MNISSLVGHIVELADLIEKNQQPADRIVGEFLRSRKYLGSRDRRFISQAIYGLVRFRRKIAVLIDQFVRENPSASDVLSPTRRFLPHYIAYAVVLEEITPQQIMSSLAARWKTFFPNVDLPLFADWLVRNKSFDFLQGDDTHQLAVWYSFQEWMVREWVGQFGTDETEELLNALNSEAPVSLRVNTLKTSIGECRARLLAEGLETQRTRFSRNGLTSAKRFSTQASPAFKEGLFEVQDEGSQIVCLLADPQEGSVVIDACAGAGGKTLMLADLMKNRGEIHAFDVEPKRLRELETRARRSGTTIIVTKPNVHPDGLEPKADLLLIDAPCSGVGTVRRNPWIKWSVPESLIDHHAQTQSKLLEDHAGLVKPGGRLVYSTCSLLRKENEEVVDGFLSRHSEFMTTLPTVMLSQLGIEFTKESRHVQLLPHKHGTDGFFVAILTKKEYIQ